MTHTTPWQETQQIFIVKSFDITQIEKTAETFVSNNGYKKYFTFIDFITCSL